MSNYNNVNRVLITGSTNSGATSLPGIQKGDLLFLDEKGNVITSAVGGSEDLARFERVK